IGFQPVELPLTGWKPIPLITRALLNVALAGSSRFSRRSHGGASCEYEGRWAAFAKDLVAGTRTMDGCEVCR
ncbi:MAG TPA: hypothetical protein P5307_24605, partial [Pirellulaceae bacterium]|nr:hypothetical protein [Pirellulaceae bacterium]